MNNLFILVSCSIPVDLLCSLFMLLCRVHTFYFGVSILEEFTWLAFFGKLPGYVPFFNETI